MRAWFRRWFPGSGKARYAATYPTAEVEHGGVTYTIRELSVGERTAFDEFSKANDTAPVLIMAWLLCQACDQFRDHNPADLALHCGPGALAKLSDAIIRQSGMHGEAVEDAEKKSPSSPS